MKKTTTCHSDRGEDVVGRPVAAQLTQQMVNDREPLGAAGGRVPLCATPGCLRDVRAADLCIDCLQVREIARPYGRDIAQLRLAESCNCLVRKGTTEVVQVCAECAPDALVEPLR